MKNFGGETLSKTHPKTLCNGNPTPQGVLFTYFGGVAIFILKVLKITLVCIRKKVASDFTFLVAFNKPKNLK